MCYRNFTLVELLVVIAIISILASLLLPTLQQAQESAKASVCVNNQRQIALGWGMYFDDFNQICPGPHWTDATGAYTRWFVAPAYYAGIVNGISAKDYGEGSSVNTPNVKTITANFQGIFRCPADNTRKADGTGMTNYGLNGLEQAQIAAKGGAMDKRRITSIKNPSQMMMLGDSGKNSPYADSGSFRSNINFYNNCKSSYGSGNMIVAMDKALVSHPGWTMNFAYVDLHVDTIDVNFLDKQFNIWGNSIFFDPSQNF